jgi:hypothetical protein
MKCLFTILLIVLFDIMTYADSFQFYYRPGSGSSVYAAYQSIKLYSGNSVVFSGYTDKFGRIAIKLKPGSYICTVLYQKKEYKMTVTIDNRSDFKMIYFGATIKPYVAKKIVTST